ncbi:aldose epimerase family protein [Christiangramia crocea]|uniref:Aldose 1-epimerase n=1 Tax=Christiangramia crocea TaxID=2904124 RepID=A0A9X2A8N1_9FLAO|nr:aldose epimerase family protein [Gramella crocea]MCG9973096.1 galactose mutarotase [Gramella crocea]
MKLLNLFITGIMILCILSCKDNKEDQKTEDHSEDTVVSYIQIDKEKFKSEIDGKKTSFYTISNEDGIEASFTNYGQRLISLWVPDRNGKFEDIVLGFSSLEEYTNAKEKYFGATIGRYGNRISKGKFDIDGKEYELVTNNGENHLHGGVKGFHNVVWDAEQPARNKLVFTRTSPHMEEGYPGALEVKVEYTLTDENELKIEYFATTDKKTVVNLTHHSFFNLDGAGSGSINDHLLMINADRFTPVERGLIPSGELRSVDKTPFDFTSMKPIGRDIETENEQLEFGQGYDHNFVLNEKPTNDEGLTLAAKVIEPDSGRKMEVYTNEPGLQFYGGNFLDGKTKGKGGEAYDYRGAFCLETQHFPDSPNQSKFPETLLVPGEQYHSVCVYKFGIEEQG